MYCLIFHSRILHSNFGIMVIGAGLQNVGPHLVVLTAFQLKGSLSCHTAVIHGGIFIMSHQLWYMEGYLSCHTCCASWRDPYHVTLLWYVKGSISCHTAVIHGGIFIMSHCCATWRDLYYITPVVLHLVYYYNMQENTEAASIYWENLGPHKYIWCFHMVIKRVMGHITQLRNNSWPAMIILAHWLKNKIWRISLFTKKFVICEKLDPIC